jgi:hypothetical protein
MSETHTDRPNGSGHSETATLKGQFSYFERWLVDMERFYEERDKRYGERFLAQDEKTTLALTASKEAIGKAETATEKRFDAVNEFREQQKDIIAEFPRRVEVDSKFTNYDEKIDDIKKDIASLRESRSEGYGGKLSNRENRQQLNWLVGILVGAGGIAVGIIIKLLP